MRTGLRLPEAETVSGSVRPSRAVFWTWVGLVVVALFLLDVLNGITYGVVVASAALGLSILTSRIARTARPELHVDRPDLIWCGGIYLGVVGLFRLAFDVFTPERTASMFLSFAAGLLLGTLGPIVYTVWLRRRPLRSLGLGLHDLRTTLGLALLFGGVQF